MSDAALTLDAFLGGRVQAWQPRVGYRAGTDPVLLAAACPARAGDSVLELGCGVGVASLCLGVRVLGVRCVGVERQAAYADLARRNGLETVEADLSALPAGLRSQSFDHVIANPPYYPRGAGTAARDPGRETALREETPLHDWIATSKARLRPKGWLTMVQSVDRLPECLSALSAGFGAISVLPLQSRIGRPPSRVLLRARKGGKTPFSLLSPLVLHEGAHHESDGDDYTERAQAILRYGAAIDWR